MKIQPLILCALLAQVPPVAAAAASVLAVDINPTTQVGEPRPPGGWYGWDESLITNGMCGWSFQLTAPTTVTGLAWYDQNPAGLSHAHEVGVWGWPPGATNGVLLLSLTIPTGTNASLLDGAWREVSLAAPVTLLAGYYVMAGTYYSENPDVFKYLFLWFGNVGIPLDPRIVAGCPAFTDSGAGFEPYDPNAPLFRPPDDYVLNDGFYFGPNLLLLPPVPSLQVRASGNHVVLSWPLWATNYVLETSAATGPAASWTATTNPAGASGQSLVATNPISTPSTFDRLRQR